MPLIIKNKRICERESEKVAMHVSAKLRDVANIKEELNEDVEFQDDSLSPRPQIKTRSISRVIQPEIRKSAQTDNAIERIRKYIPAEILIAWTMIKMGFDETYGGQADTPAEIATFSSVWAGFVGVVFLYVFESLRRERLVVVLDDDLSIADMISHSLISSMAFVLYSMTLGPPFSLWGVPSFVPMIGLALFTLMVSLVGDPYISKPSAVTNRQQQSGVAQPLVAGGGENHQQ